MRANTPVRRRSVDLAGEDRALRWSDRQPQIDAGTESIDMNVPVHHHLSDLEAKLDMLQRQVRQAQQLAQTGIAAATMAHEVNNLLTPIVNYASEAMSRDDAFKEKALRITHKNAQMLISMSRRILHLNAAEAIHIESVGLHEVVEDGVESLCREPSKDGISFVNDVETDCRVLADALSLRQVFFNLFLNARDVMVKRRGGRIRVNATRQSEMVCIRVEDDAGGIPRLLQPYVFEPLQSSKVRDAEPARCSGLGLSLCRSLLEGMGGRIAFETVEGEGTTFLIDLPVG